MRVTQPTCILGADRMVFEPGAKAKDGEERLKSTPSCNNGLGILTTRSPSPLSHGFYRQLVVHAPRLTDEAAEGVYISKRSVI